MRTPCSSNFWASGFIIRNYCRLFISKKNAIEREMVIWSNEILISAFEATIICFGRSMFWYLFVSYVSMAMTCIESNQKSCCHSLFPLRITIYTNSRVRCVLIHCFFFFFSCGIEMFIVVVIFSAVFCLVNLWCMEWNMNYRNTPGECEFVLNYCAMYIYYWHCW